MLVNLQALIADAKCYEVIRQLRRPDGVRCPVCGAAEIIKRGFHTQQAHRQRYQYRACRRQIDDLTGATLAGHHQPLRIWVLCLYFMGLNLPNQQIAAELELHPDVVHDMTTHLRERIVIKKPVSLSGKIELDEVHVIAGHEGQPDIVAKLGRAGRRRRLKGKRGRRRLGGRPPVFGMLQRDGAVVITRLPNVQRATIEPLIQRTIQSDNCLYTNEYDIYNHLGAAGYTHKTVNDSTGEYARDDDGEGFCETQVNSWLLALNLERARPD